MDFWAIANDDPATLAEYVESQGFDFPMLVDDGGLVIESWGLLNAVDPKGRKIPHPALVTLDRDGLVRDLFVETNYRLRPAVPEVLERLESALGGGPDAASEDD